MDTCGTHNYTSFANKNERDNCFILSNCIELVTTVIKTIADKDIAESITEGVVTREVLTNMVGSYIKKRLNV